MLRYEAQLIVQKCGKSLGDTTEVARAMKAAQDPRRQRTISSKQKERRLETQSRHDLAKKESMDTAKLRGLPMVENYSTNYGYAYSIGRWHVTGAVPVRCRCGAG